uniref:Mitochondrial S-adenosylmethionine carrier protein n=1 Tax=Suricata suricatta TaxID=37032 RepID=A0A673TNP5_SURSU
PNRQAAARKRSQRRVARLGLTTSLPRLRPSVRRTTGLSFLGCTCSCFGSISRGHGSAGGTGPPPRWRHAVTGVAIRFCSVPNYSLCAVCGAMEQPGFMTSLVVACLIRVPSEVVKQRTQVSASSRTFQIFSNILYQEGIHGLYRGYTSTVLREVTRFIPSPEVQKDVVPWSANSFRETG